MITLKAHDPFYYLFSLTPIFLFVVFKLVPSTTSANECNTETRSVDLHTSNQSSKPPKSRPINVPLRENQEAAGKYINTHEYIH